MNDCMIVQRHRRGVHHRDDFPCTLIYTLRQVCATIGKREK